MYYSILYDFLIDFFYKSIDKFEIRPYLITIKTYPISFKRILFSCIAYYWTHGRIVSPFLHQKYRNLSFHVFNIYKDIGFNTSIRPKHIKNIICIFVQYLMAKKKQIDIDKLRDVAKAKENGDPKVKPNGFRSILTIIPNK